MITDTLLVIALVVLCMSLLISLLGLLVTVMDYMFSNDWNLALAFTALYYSIFLFVTGIMTAVVESTGLPNSWTLLVGFVIGVILGAPLVPPFRRAAKRRLRTSKDTRPKDEAR